MRLILSRSAAYFRSPGPQSHPNDRPSAKMLCFIIIYRKYKFKKNRCIPLPLAGEGKGIAFMNGNPMMTEKSGFACIPFSLSETGKRNKGIPQSADLLQVLSGYAA